MHIKIIIHFNEYILEYGSFIFLDLTDFVLPEALTHFKILYCICACIFMWMRMWMYSCAGMCTSDVEVRGQPQVPSSENPLGSEIVIGRLVCIWWSLAMQTGHS